ncbi:hypothetical protein TRIP_D310115 [uncultured Paludibacter sp.]|uniref:Uncharacterized protein n=1 Tax=uncultured Paludibacter sp. TaxID=497635 RepID=A0A653ACD4_9BACT|nr:hypothetical protein TRIP_D310115 [uncultured Paludibacter sp.]
MKLFFIIILAVYVITIIVDVFVTIRQKNKFIEIVYRAILVYPIIISFLSLIIFIQLMQPRIYKKDKFYGIRTSFAYITPPEYLSIKKTEKITHYKYERSEDWEGIVPVRSNVFLLQDINHKMGVSNGYNIIKGDSIKFTTKKINIQNKEYPIDIVIVYKGDRRDTVTFNRNKELPNKIDTIDTYSFFTFDP